MTHKALSLLLASVCAISWASRVVHVVSPYHNLFDDTAAASNYVTTNCIVANPSDHPQEVTIQYINALMPRTNTRPRIKDIKPNTNFEDAIVSQLIDTNGTIEVKWTSDRGLDPTIIYSKNPSIVKFSVNSTDDQGYVIANCSTSISNSNGAAFRATEVPVSGGKPF